MTRLLLAFLILPLHAESRIFTNNKGKTLNAELIRADETRAWLQLAGGKLVPVKTSTLSEADQKYVKAWLMDQIPRINVTPRFTRSLTKAKGAKNKKKPKILQKYTFSVEVANLSKEKPLEECEVLYYIVGKSTVDQKVYKVLTRQTGSLNLNGDNAQTITFKDVHNYFGDERDYKVGYRVVGYVLSIRRKRDNRIVALEAPSTILTKKTKQISALKKGAYTGIDFVKPVPDPDPENIATETTIAGEPGVITIDTK